MLTFREPTELVHVEDASKIIGGTEANIDSYSIFPVRTDGVIQQLSYPEIPINTELFRTEAKHFNKYGRYCDDRRGSSGYTEYWDEQERRCKEGYSVGGMHITGDHYGYLNFSQIKLTPERNREEGIISKDIPLRSVARRKTRAFPSFFDGDWFYFKTIDLCEYDGEHLCVGKSRRKGYSYKNAWILANRYKQEVDSVSLLGAYDNSYLLEGDGTMTMSKNYINFLNEHTDWARRKLIDRIDRQQDGFKRILSNGIEVKDGYLSQIIAVSCYNNSSALRGNDGTLVFLEEAGKFPNLLEVLASTLPALKDGIYVTGLLIVFGTGGGKDVDWAPFEKVMYDPRVYNMKRFVNIWDEGMAETFCSFFHPDYVGKPGFVDTRTGRTNRTAAHRYEVEEREIINKANDLEASKNYQMEYSFSPSEAFDRTVKNIFGVENVKKIKQHRQQVFGSKLHINSSLSGSIEKGSTGFIFKPSSEAKAIWEFPHKTNNMEGCVVQYFPPIKVNGVIPDNLYIVCNDPFGVDKDDPNSENSLGATYVICNHNPYRPEMGGRVVASYIGRPAKQDTYNEQMFFLAAYYNAKIGYENDRGDVLGWAKRHRKYFKYLEPEFELGWSTTMKNISGRGYGMSMKNQEVKRQGDLFIKDWLMEERATREDGSIIYTFETITDIGLLDEIIKYNGIANSDRLSAIRIGMYHFKELDYKEIRPQSGSGRRANDPYFRTPLYTN